MPTPKDYVERSNRINQRLIAHEGAGHAITNHLTDAGKEASDVLRDLLDDKAFWTLLATKKPEGDLKPEQVSDAALQFHAKLLKDLGHRPPPPPEQYATEIRQAILDNQGAAAESIEQVRQKVTALKTHIDGLTAAAKLAMSKKVPAAEAKPLGQRLVRGLKDACLYVSTAATMLGAWYAANPPVPPPPPPIIIVIPQPGQPQPGLGDLGTIYYWRALPPPPPPEPPGSQRT